MVYKGFCFLTGGDKNDLEVKNILDISPNLHMHNTRPTHGKKNIDILVSDMAHLYDEPYIIPNVPTDIPDGQPGGGKPSDHPIVYCKPRLERQSKPAKQVVVKKTRRFSNLQKKDVANWIQHESWEELFNSDKPAETFVQIVFEKLNKICPEEEIKITKLDGKVKSLALQKLGRQKLREYTNHGNSNRFKALKKLQKSRIKLEGQKALDKLFENAGEKGTKWIREASRMSSRPGEDSSSTFSLQSHIDENLTPRQSAERIVEYFSQISKEYTPIEEDSSAPWMEVQAKLEAAPCIHPPIEEHLVYQNTKEAKKTDSVPGDIPAKILKEFLPEFATPVTTILKNAVETHTWPEIYKKEYHLPLKKIPAPQNEDDIRGIGLTSFVSKQLERLVLNWI